LRVSASRKVTPREKATLAAATGNMTKAKKGIDNRNSLGETLLYTKKGKNGTVAAKPYASAK